MEALSLSEDFGDCTPFAAVKRVVMRHTKRRRVDHRRYVSTDHTPFAQPKPTQQNRPPCLATSTTYVTLRFRKRRLVSCPAYSVPFSSEERNAIGKTYMFVNWYREHSGKDFFFLFFFPRGCVRAFLY